MLTGSISEQLKVEIMRSYLIGSDRCLVYTKSPMLVGWEECTDLDVIKAFAPKCDPKYKPGLTWIGSKMPSELFKKVLGTIAQFPRMETAFSIYYKISDKSWHIKVPAQYGHGASVRFEDNGDGVPAGYALIGSIHTHPEMGAFWSGTDMNDQSRKYGLHMVFGLRSGKVDQHKCTIFTPTAKYDQQLWDVVEETDLKADYEAPKEWVEKINAQEYKPAVPPLSLTHNSGYYYEFDRKTGTWVHRYSGVKPYKYSSPGADLGSTVVMPGGTEGRYLPKLSLPDLREWNSDSRMPDKPVSKKVSKARKSLVTALEVLIQKGDLAYVQDTLADFGLSTIDLETGGIVEARYEDCDDHEDDISWEESLEAAMELADEATNDPEYREETLHTLRQILGRYGYVPLHDLREQHNDAMSKSEANACSTSM